MHPRGESLGMEEVFAFIPSGTGCSCTREEYEDDKVLWGCSKTRWVPGIPIYLVLSTLGIISSPRWSS